MINIIIRYILFIDSYYQFTTNEDGAILNLLFAPKNTQLEITNIRSRKNKISKQERQLASMGFVKGSILTIIQEQEGGMIVKIKDCRLGLGRDLASKIEVKEVL